METLDYCVMSKECPGPSKLVDTCYGFTGGDKWRCTKCQSYVVVGAQVTPSRPK